MKQSFLDPVAIFEVEARHARVGPARIRRDEPKTFENCQRRVCHGGAHERGVTYGVWCARRIAIHGQHSFTHRRKNLRTFAWPTDVTYDGRTDADCLCRLVPTRRRTRNHNGFGAPVGRIA